MKNSYTLLLFFVLAISVAFVFEGCSSKKKKVYTIARDPTWYPARLMNKEKSLLAFSDDLVIAIAKAEGFHVDLILANSTSIESGLQQGYYDAILSPLLPLPTQLANYQFSLPYFMLGPVLIVRADFQADSLKDMKDRRVGVVTNAYVSFDPNHYPSSIIRFYDRPDQGLTSLVKGEIDGLIMDLLFAYSYMHGLYADQIKVVGKPLNQDGLRLIIDRASGDPALVRLFNEGLQKVKESGEYAELLHRWDLDNPS